jgi:hypothetical protein
MARPGRWTRSEYPCPHPDEDTVWYGRTMLIFKVRVQTDDDLAQGGVETELEIAMVEVFTSVRLPSALSPHRRLVVYAPAPKPRVYMIRCDDILGKLPVVPMGDTGTWNDDLPGIMIFGNDARRDTPGQPGSGSAVWYVNTWAMRWAKDKFDPSQTHEDSSDSTDNDADG